MARDSLGELLFAKSIYKQGLVDADFAEAMAIKEALSWVKELDWQGVIVESDCLVAVQAVRSKAAMASPFGCIIEQCR